MITKKHNIIAMILIWSIAIYTSYYLHTNLPCNFGDVNLNDACAYDQQGSIGFIIFMGFFVSMLSIVFRKAINEWRSDNVHSKRLLK